jgi:hypothetical protein
MDCDAQGRRRRQRVNGVLQRKVPAVCGAFLGRLSDDGHERWRAKKKRSAGGYHRRFAKG